MTCFISSLTKGVERFLILISFMGAWLFRMEENALLKAPRWSLISGKILWRFEKYPVNCAKSAANVDE